MFGFFFFFFFLNCIFESVGFFCLDFFFLICVMNIEHDFDVS